MKKTSSILLALTLLSLAQFAQAAQNVRVLVSPHVVSTICTKNGAIEAHCYFDVPAGRILQIENVSGYTIMGSVLFIGLQYASLPATAFAITQWLVPATSKELTSVIFSSSVQGYATDSNALLDSEGATHDLRILIRTDGFTEGPADAVTVVGRLLRAP